MSNNLNIHIPDEVWEWIQHYANWTDTSIDSIVLTALIEFQTNKTEQGYPWE